VTINPKKKEEVVKKISMTSIILNFKTIFKGNTRRLSLTTCLIFLLIVLWNSPQNVMAKERIGVQQLNVSTQQETSITRHFYLKGKTREMVEFEVTNTGTIEAKAEWAGKAKTLALILNGPGQVQYYAREDGKSPLTLSYEVPQNILSLGKKWKISVVNFKSGTIAQGKVQVTYPETRKSAKPIKPVETEVSEPVTKPAEGKQSLTIKHYEVQESEGFTTQQLKEIKVKLEEQKIEHTKIKIENRLKEIAPENPLVKIVIPLMYKNMEEKSQKPLIKNRINTSPHLQTVVQAYKSLSPEITSKYFHPRYSKLKAGQKIDKLQLGKDILETIRPNYKSQIRQMVRNSISAESPKFQWNAARARKTELKKNDRMQVKSKQYDIKKLDMLVNELKTSPTQANIDALRDFVQAEGLGFEGIEGVEGVEIENNDIHQAIADGLQAAPEWIPDLNSDHFVSNYYKYDIELDWFQCIDQNERTCVWIPFWGWECSDDEPYWHLSSTIPRYDPDDPDQIHRLHEGELYMVFSQVTGTYDDLNNGETRAFRPQDRSLLDRNIYNTKTTFTIALWEEDWSKAEVRDAIHDAIEDLRDYLIEEIKDAVMDAIKEAVYEGLLEALPDELHAVLQLFFEGQISFSSLMDAVQTVMGGVDIGMIALQLIFSGESITTIITGLGGACPEITIALIAIKVAGPIAIDFFQGDFEDAFEGLLYLPLKLFEFFKDLFTDIVGFFEDIMAIIDPDDHIQTRSVTIKGSFDNIYQDARWGDDYSGAYVSGMPSGCGPNSNNSSIMWREFYLQPFLRFEGADAKYRAYYNVKRTLVGGRETFGFTTRHMPHPTSVQVRTYTAKSSTSRTKLKVSYCTLNTDEIPFIMVSKKIGGVVVESWTNGVYSEPEFYVDFEPGAEYEITIINFLPGVGDLYGYVTFEEE
jgi:hypothetical protein